MNRLLTHTRGLGSWRERLANPDRQWRREFSAFETAVSWEDASARASGIPVDLENLLRANNYDAPILLLGIAEHTVPLLGGHAASQSDVWALISTSLGLMSLSVEAKARESFGDEKLDDWLVAGSTDASRQNRKDRWGYIRENLPLAESFGHVRYQILHRCAAAVIEAKRLGCPNAAFVVQAFNTPDASFQDYAAFCAALKMPAVRGGLSNAFVDRISLSVGWIDCPLASDAAVAACA
jgi:hypothetical protein